MHIPLHLLRVLRLAALVLMAVSAAHLLAQQAPDGPASASAETSEKTVVLSPFQVAAESDEGYAARETLAGSRLKMDLKDVASQISVMTEEFLQDIATVSLEDAFRYSLNVESNAEYT